MKKIFTILLLSAGICFPQTFNVKLVKGDVKAQIGTSEKWEKVKHGEKFEGNTVFSTGKNSYVKIESSNSKFDLKSFSALKLSSIKKMTINDLILALAMEDMLNAPKKKENTNSQNTAVYGAEINGIKTPMVESDDFGIKKLNGAIQLAESGYKKSAVVVAEETFRKYPETSNLAAYRIYFADILYNIGLNEDAYDDFKSIDKLKLDKNEKDEVKSKLDILAKKLLK